MNHYYAFVDLLPSSVSNAIHPYKYNGKELDAKKGLNWYDYGEREYDAALGIFTTVDPSSEKYYPTSLYTYCGSEAGKIWVYYNNFDTPCFMDCHKKNRIL